VWLAIACDEDYLLAQITRPGMAFTGACPYELIFIVSCESQQTLKVNTDSGIAGTIAIHPVFSGLLKRFFCVFNALGNKSGQNHNVPYQSLLTNGIAINSVVSFKRKLTVEKQP